MDPLLAAVDALAADERIAAPTDAARGAFDELLWRRDVRKAAAEAMRSSIDRGARDSAAIDGADIVAVDDSPMGRVLAAAVAVTAQAGELADDWGRAPLQVLASLHATAARGFAPDDDLGRPRSDDNADDPLAIGSLPVAGSVAPRLTSLSDIAVHSKVPALVVAGIVHGELMLLRPFGWGSGLVARAVVRCVLAQRGLDPDNWAIPERGMLELGRPAYVRAVRAYASGTREGMVEYLTWFSTAAAAGARAVVV